MRGRFFLLVMVVLFLSCEDPTTLPVSRIFSGNKLQTAFVDTFSVITSTVQLDSVQTNGTGSLLLGKYHDTDLGAVASSAYFQLGFTGTFTPKKNFTSYDSIALIMHYDHSYTGDTTQAVKFNLYQLKEQMLVRLLPRISFLQTSVFNANDGFYNNTTFEHASTPIASISFYPRPHRDSLFVRLPDSFGSNLFQIAQSDTAQASQLFTDASKFVSRLMWGMYMETDPTTSASVIGFKASNLTIRLYYKESNGDVFKRSRFDFTIYPNAGYQFNHIDFDRSGTASALAAQPKFKALSSDKTNNKTYIQAGTGLVTRIEFPSLRNFFQLNNNVIINAAYLDVQPVRGSYPITLLPPSSLQLYDTDNSNIPFITSLAGNATIVYDYDYGLNTVYRFQIFPYLLGQLKNNSDHITPLILAPVGPQSQGSNVKRVYLGDRFYTDSKIKLKIFYSYAIN